MNDVKAHIFETGTTVYDQDGNVVGHLGGTAESRFVKHERSITIALIVAIPILITLALIWRESHARTDANRELIVEIQKSRAETTYTTCLGQNSRHEATVAQLDKVIATRKTLIRKQIKESESLAEQAALRAQLDAIDDARATTVGLIDALAPLANCEQMVVDRFGYVPQIGGEDG